MKVYSTKRAIIDLLTVQEQVTRVFNGSEKYRRFIDFIFSKDYLGDNNLKIPTIKEISTEIDLSNTKVTKLIRDLYDELFDNKFIFNKTEVIFHVKRFDYYVFLECNDLKYIPRVGDEIHLPFVKAKTDCDIYYVERIEHSFAKNLHRININLKGGFYNQYFHYEKNKAYENGKISFDDFYFSEDYIIRNKLKFSK